MSLKSDAIFDKIKAKVASLDPAGPRKVEGIFLHNITQNGQQVKQWTLDMHALSLYEGAPPEDTDITGTVTIEDEDLFLLGTKQLTHKEAVAQGKVVITGDAELFEKLGESLGKL